MENPWHLPSSLVPFWMSVQAAQNVVICHGPFEAQLNVFNVEIQIWQFGGNVAIKSTGYNYRHTCRQLSERTVCNEICHSRTSQLHMAAGLPTCYTDTECTFNYLILGFLLQKCVYMQYYTRNNVVKFILKICVFETIKTFLLTHKHHPMDVILDIWQFLLILSQTRTSSGANWVTYISHLQTRTHFISFKPVSQCITQTPQWQNHRSEVSL